MRGSSANVITPEETALFKNIHEYIIHSSTEEQDLVIHDTEGKLIVAKLSRLKARYRSGNKHGGKYKT